MTRYLLDTNIISNVVRPEPSPHLLLWLGAQADNDLFIATLTLGEIRRGILEKPEGRRRAALEAWFEGPEGPRALFAGRILPFDEPAALVWAALMAQGNRASAQCPRHDDRRGSPWRKAASSQPTTCATSRASRPSIHSAGPDRAARPIRCGGRYSHSIVPGGFEVMS